MERRQRRRALWVVLAVFVGLAATVAPLLAIAGSDGATFTATRFADLVRFEAEGVVSLRVRVFDLAETILWDSGVLLGDMVDWDRTDTNGERVANGLYVYHVQGWDVADSLALDKTGKVALLPGDQVELKTAPVVGPVTGDPLPGEEDGPIYGPQAYNQTNWYVQNELGVGTDNPDRTCDIVGNIYVGDGAGYDSFLIGGRALSQSRISCYYNHDSDTMGLSQQVTTGSGRNEVAQLRFTAVGDDSAYLSFYTANGGGKSERVRITQAGNVGIGTSNATDKLTIQGSSGNLIACYPDGSRTAGSAVFRVESDGDVYADGTAFAADFVAGGGADVAERINVSEWVEAGDVVEIDPEHIGFFRKADGEYSRRVAGIISTSPGVILGNASDPASDEWSDNRPVLAIAGRVPVKVTTENGPIAVGDLLVSSSVPGVAMRGDPGASIGAVVGKAMEPLEDDEGVIMAQVTLR